MTPVNQTNVSVVETPRHFGSCRSLLDSSKPRNCYNHEKGGREKNNNIFFWFLVGGFSPGTGSVLVALGRGWINLGNRSQGLHGAKMGGLCHPPIRQNREGMGNLEAKQYVPGLAAYFWKVQTQRDHRGRRGVTHSQACKTHPGLGAATSWGHLRPLALLKLRSWHSKGSSFGSAISQAH